VLRVDQHRNDPNQHRLTLHFCSAVSSLQASKPERHSGAEPRAISKKPGRSALARLSCPSAT
jgi:hypothetical protein